MKLDKMLRSNFFTGNPSVLSFNKERCSNE
jgi:hypothetical protein